MAEVEVRVLGPLEVVVDGTLLTGLPRLERTLLAALAVRAGRPVSVSALAADVWADPPPSWRKSLQVRVARIRRRLEDAGLPADVLATTGEGYRLALDADRIDAHRFHRCFEEGRRLLDEGRPDAARETLDAGLALWRGDPLPELADTAGGQAEVARLVELRHLAVEERTEAILALGRHGEAVADAERNVADAPLRERRWAQLMVALYRSGRQADALRAFQRARDLLVEELGLEPGPELARIEAAVIHHDPSLDLQPAGPPGAAAAPVARIGTEPELLWVDWQRQVPLVGRARERAVLAEAWSKVRDDSLGGVVVLTGRSGVGKTRLVAELAKDASDEGAWVLAFRCAPGVGLVPMGPGPLSLGVDLPAVSTGPPAAAAAVEYGLAIFDRVMAVAEQRPVLLVFDDLHRAEPFVVEAMRTVADRPVMPLDGSLPVLTVATFRDAATLPPGVHALVHQVRQLHVEALLGLGPLPPDDARALVAERLAVGGTGDLGRGRDLDALVAHVGGNPRRLIELARHLRSTAGSEVAEASEPAQASEPTQASESAVGPELPAWQRAAGSVVALGSEAAVGSGAQEPVVAPGSVAAVGSGSPEAVVAHESAVAVGSEAAVALGSVVALGSEVAAGQQHAAAGHQAAETPPLGGAGRAPTPERLRQVVGEELAELPEDLVAFLAAVAVAGPEVGTATAARAAGVDDETAARLVERAAGAGYLATDGAGDRVRFITPLEREVLLGMLSEARRATIAERAAATTTATTPTGVTATAAAPNPVAPAETTPTGITPAETTPAESTPAETASTETTPAATTPAATTPTGITPTETTPTETTPAEIAPTEITATGVTATVATPNTVAPTERTPVEIARAETAPTGITPAAITPAGITSTGTTSTENTPNTVAPTMAAAAPTTAPVASPLAVTPATAPADPSPPATGPADPSPPALFDGPDLLWAARQLQVPLAGRAAERERLLHAWRQVCDRGKTGLVVITAGAGLGKTRLLAEVARAAVDAGGAALGGRFSATLGLSPLGGDVAILGVAPPAAEALRGPDVVIGYLRELFDRLLDVTRRQPAVVLLDDAHLASAELVDGMRRLVDRPIPMAEGRPILVVAAQRPGGRGGHGIAPLVRDLQRVDVRDELDLASLDPDDSLRLLEAVLGDDLDAASAEQLALVAGCAGGIPGHLVELGRHLAASGIVRCGHWDVEVSPTIAAAAAGSGVGIVRESGGGRDPEVVAPGRAGVGVPTALRSAVEADLAELPADVVRLLTAAAVVGPSFDLASAARAAGIDDGQALDALDHAVAARVVAETADGYRFASEVEQVVLADRLSAGRRALIRSRLGDGPPTP